MCVFLVYKCSTLTEIHLTRSMDIRDPSHKLKTNVFGFILCFLFLFWLFCFGFCLFGFYICFDLFSCFAFSFPIFLIFKTDTRCAPKLFTAIELNHGFSHLCSDTYVYIHIYISAIPLCGSSEAVKNVFAAW